MVYLTFLIEDLSGEVLIRRVLDRYAAHHPNLQYETHRFGGKGHLPKKTGKIRDIKTKRMLNDLPQYLHGFCRSLAPMPGRKAIFVIIDSDHEDCAELKRSILALAPNSPDVPIHICIAIEEMEAWLLGDWNAIQSAFPTARKGVWESYVPDSIVGTWERLADVVFDGGVKALRKQHPTYAELGKEKCRWAQEIGAFMDLSGNQSPSFRHFIAKLDGLSG